MRSGPSWRAPSSASSSTASSSRVSQARKLSSTAVTGWSTPLCAMAASICIGTREVCSASGASCGNRTISNGSSTSTAAGRRRPDRRGSLPANGCRASAANSSTPVRPAPMAASARAVGSAQARPYQRQHQAERDEQQHAGIQLAHVQGAAGRAEQEQAEHTVQQPVNHHHAPVRALILALTCQQLAGGGAGGQHQQPDQQHLRDFQQAAGAARAGHHRAKTEGVGLGQRAAGSGCRENAADRCCPRQRTVGRRPAAAS